MPKADKWESLISASAKITQNSSERKWMLKEVLVAPEAQQINSELERKNIRDGKITASVER